MSIKRNALGKGLSALLENIETDVTSKTGATEESPATVGNVARPMRSGTEIGHPTEVLLLRQAYLTT